MGLWDNLVYQLNNSSFMFGHKIFNYQILSYLNLKGEYRVDSNLKYYYFITELLNFILMPTFILGH